MHDYNDYRRCCEADSPSVLMADNIRTIGRLLEERALRIAGTDDPNPEVPWDSGTVKFIEDAIEWELNQVEHCWNAIHKHGNSWVAQAQAEDFEAEMQADETLKGN